MLPSELLWGALASLVVRVSCSNEFVSFPSEFDLDKRTEIHWDNLEGYIAGIRVHSSGPGSGWLLEPNCSGSDHDHDDDDDDDDDDDSNDSKCKAYANNGTAYFYSDGSQVPLGSGYELRLFWTKDESYGSIDDDAKEVKSSGFSVVPSTSKDKDKKPKGGLSKGAKIGIAVGVIALVLFLIVVLLWKFKKARRNKKRKTRKDEEHDGGGAGGGGGRWASTVGKATWEIGAAAVLPEKTGLMSGAFRKSGGGIGGGGRGGLVDDHDGHDAHDAHDARPFLDNKAELQTPTMTAAAAAAAPAAAPQRQLSPPRSAARRVGAVAANTMELDATSTAVNPVELPGEPLGPYEGAGARQSSGTGNTLLVHHPEPSYVLQPPSSSNYAEPSPASTVSPVSPTHNGGAAAAAAAAAAGPRDGAVSPVSPISRKPVGASTRVAPVQRQQYGAAWRS